MCQPYGHARARQAPAPVEAGTAVSRWVTGCHPLSWAPSSDNCNHGSLAHITHTYTCTQYGRYACHAPTCGYAHQCCCRVETQPESGKAWQHPVCCCCAAQLCHPGVLPLVLCSQDKVTLFGIHARPPHRPPLAPTTPGTLRRVTCCATQQGCALPCGACAGGGTWFSTPVSPGSSSSGCCASARAG